MPAFFLAHAENIAVSESDPSQVHGHSFSGAPGGKATRGRTAGTMLRPVHRRCSVPAQSPITSHSTNLLLS